MLSERKCEQVDKKMKEMAETKASALQVLLLMLYAANLTLSYRVTSPSQYETENVISLPEVYYQARASNANPDYLSFPNWNRGSSHQADPQIGPNKEVYQFTRKLLNSISKRTAYAHTKEEIQDEYQQEKDIGTGIGMMRKRNDATETHSGGCIANKLWPDLGPDYFPRFIKTYNCISNACNPSYGVCRPKLYAVKVLKKMSPGVSDEECDIMVPPDLRCKWKFEAYNVTTYCECLQVTPMPLFG